MKEILGQWKATKKALGIELLLSQKLRPLLEDSSKENIANVILLLQSFGEEGIAEIFDLQNQEFVIPKAYTHKNLSIWDEQIINIVSTPQSIWFPFFEQKGFYSMEMRYLSQKSWASLSPSMQNRLIHLSMTMKTVPAGSFAMGISEQTRARGGYKAEKPQHNVHISNAFDICAYACTQGLFEDVMESNNSEGALLPIRQVSWIDAIRFCNRLSTRHDKQKFYRIPPELEQETLHKDGFQNSSHAFLPQIKHNLAANGYRLPTEAQWEYAAAFGWTDVIPTEPMTDWAWYSKNTRSVQFVGQKKGNALGLYDVLGNVWEWTEDGYQADVYTYADRSDPLLQNTKPYRILRGGSYCDGKDTLRTSNRHASFASLRQKNIGFRWICPTN